MVAIGRFFADRKRGGKSGRLSRKRGPVARGPKNHGETKRVRARRRLVWTLAFMAAAALGTSSLLAFVALPTAKRQSHEALAEAGAVADMQAAVSNQGDADRGYLLTGDPARLKEFDAAGRSLAQAEAVFLRTASAAEKRGLAHAQAAYEQYLSYHRVVIDLVAHGARDGAVQLSLGVGSDTRFEAEARIDQLQDVVVRESDRDVADNHRHIVLLTTVLLALSIGPGVAAFVLGRTIRLLAQDERLTAERKRLADAQRVAHLGSWEADMVTGEVRWSEEMYRILGLEPDADASLEVLFSHVHPEDLADVQSVVAAPRPPGDRFEYVSRVIRPDGTVRWLATQGETVGNAEGTVVRVVGTALDITARAEAAAEATEARDRLAAREAEMRHRAYHDALTGLPNRAMLLEALDEAAGRSATVAVLVLDLDGFKRINDSLGHNVGDRLLIQVGRRLSSAVRGLEGGRDPDIVARLGGDEFAVLVNDVGQAQAEAVAERLIGDLGQPFRIDGRELVVSASIGLAMASWSAGGREAMRDADVAMYQAKRTGGGRCAVFDPAMRAAAVERLALEAELRAVIENGGLAVYYQPIVDPTTGVVEKLEALVRWPHPERGMIGPDLFIPLAEETGLIVPLGAWVLETACATAAGYPGVRMAVNLSARQLDEPDLVDTVTAVLARTGLDPARLVLEVTESMVMEQGPGGGEALRELHALGVGLAIDDFGTGYSSLSRLRALPATELKIDKSFIDEVDQAGDKAPVVAAVIALAHGLGRTVVAEGVETAGQLASLARLGCDLVQGFLLSRPLPTEEVRQLLAFPAPFSAFATRTGGGPGDVDEEVMAAVARAVAAGDAGVDRARPLLAELAALTGMESAYLTRIDLDEGVQTVVAAHNSSNTFDIAEGSAVPWADTLCRRALATGTRQSDDVAADFPDCAVAADLGLRTYVMVPVTGPSGALVGTLCAAGQRARPVDAGAVRLLEVFSRLLGETLDPADGRRTRPVRVVIADDSPVVRSLLRHVLTADGTIEVVAEAVDGREAVAACSDAQPDVILLDLDMPELDGLAALPLLAEAAPSTKVVVLSAEGGRATAAAGELAAAVVDKRIDPVRLRSVVVAVA
jgi:diguanylate cyclase (GGDEF)-like protein/PAS domain S-box-containing protein